MQDQPRGQYEPIPIPCHHTQHNRAKADNRAGGAVSGLAPRRDTAAESYSQRVLSLGPRAPPMHGHVGTLARRLQVAVTCGGLTHAHHLGPAVFSNVWVCVGARADCGWRLCGDEHPAGAPLSVSPAPSNFMSYRPTCASGCWWYYP